MEERRRSKRTDLEAKILVKRLDSEETAETAIEITDVSETGVGFNCSEPLTVGAVYEVFLTIWTKEVLHAFLEIVRADKTGFDFVYGAIFIGMSKTDAARIRVYQTVSESL